MISTSCCSLICPGRSKARPFLTQLQVVLHQDSDRIQIDLRKLHNPSPSLTQRSTWITPLRFEMREPPRVRAPLPRSQPRFRFKQIVPLNYNSRPRRTRGWGSHHLSKAPVLVIHSQPEDYSELLSGSHPGLTITSMAQGCFRYWKGLESPEVLEFDSCLVAQSTLR
jgi:hypothetical protein